MQIQNDQVENMVASLHKFNAEQVIYKYDIEKNGEKFIFEIALKRGSLEEVEDE